METILGDLFAFIVHLNERSALELGAGIVSLLGGWWYFTFAAKRHRQRAWFRRQTDMRALRSMSWQKFEIFTSELFRKQGYSVKETGGGGKDGGIDLILVKSGRKYVVQCKHYRSSSVGASVVRELAGVAAREKAHGSIVVTVGKFTKDAQKFADGMPIQLIDGPGLLRMSAGRSRRA